MTDIADWYKQLPRFTKYWLSLTVGISLLAKIGILPDYYLVLFWDFVWRKFHVSVDQLLEAPAIKISFFVDQIYFCSQRYGDPSQRYSTIR